VAGRAGGMRQPTLLFCPFAHLFWVGDAADARAVCLHSAAHRSPWRALFVTRCLYRHCVYMPMATIRDTAWQT